MNKEIREENGRIYFGNILNSGKISSNNKFDITDNVLQEVCKHIMKMDGFLENGYAGYSFNKTIGGGTITLLVLDDNKVEINKKQPYVETVVDADEIKELDNTEN